MTLTFAKSQNALIYFPVLRFQYANDLV